ncbi:MAG: hypothetical protein O3B01_08855 [Planctomycetota bacterium]|nr:hypothetical protein [Planctomycetota bacterium]MDA1138679.1 hypothetical protein [Planctomycetota bacterium]
MLFGIEYGFPGGYVFGGDSSYKLMMGWDNAPTIANVEATGSGSAKVRTTYTVEHSLGGPPWTKEIELEQGITVTELPPEVSIVGAPREAIQARMKVRLLALHAPWKEDLQFTWSSRVGDDGGQVAVHNSGRIIAIHPGTAWVKAEAVALVNGQQQTVSAEVEIKIEEPELGIYTSSTFLLLGEFTTLSANTSHHGGEWLEWTVLKIDGLNEPAALHVIQDE